ncbi:MazG family protein [Amycolatopsis magusensis]|uniref:MazG family protein n=1 Tax=Amycolatopsis magusensis TaxID=882444 RepID=UPI003794A307
MNTVVLAPAALPAVLPAAAWPALRSADVVYAAGDLPEVTRVALDAKAAPAPEELLRATGAVVLVAADRTDPGAAALLEAGAALVSVPVPAVVEAVAVMDKLRSPGGCPWDAAQTHDSLRQYLVEETYELLEAIEDGDRAALREELGDVLLQVLFHARVAAEDGQDPFDIEDVAGELVAKLIGRHPHVFGGDEVIDTAEHQQVRWEELKQTEKRRESIVDGVALGQPAVALAGKLGQRTGRAGLPPDLFPAGDTDAEQLFRLAASARRAGVDPEGALRAVAKRFAADVRTAEASARSAGVTPQDPPTWRHHWPH